MWKHKYVKFLVFGMGVTVSKEEGYFRFSEYFCNIMSNLATRSNRMCGILHALPV